MRVCVEYLGRVVVAASEAVRDATRFMRNAEPGAIGYGWRRRHRCARERRVVDTPERRSSDAAVGLQ
jgi:hypothetical protein